MTRGLCFFVTLPLLVGASRILEVEEHTADSRSVPKPIYDALREANGVVQKHLDSLEEANRTAEQRKVESKQKIDEKIRVMKDMQAKTDKSAAKAKTSRDLMLKVEQAAAQHTKAGEEHKKSMTKFGSISDDLDDLARKITLKEQALRQVVSTYKRQIADLKAQLDKKAEEKKAAEDEMKDLKTQAASAGKFKTGVQQEQAKAEKEMQQAQQELRAVRGELETAVSAATVAEAQEAQAVNEAREANGRLEEAKKTKDYLMKIRTAVRGYYGSIDDFEAAVDGKANVQLKSVPEAKTTLEKYNMMISSFLDLHAYDAEVYSKVTPAIKEVKDNAFAQIQFICDEMGTKTKAHQEHCLSGLWDALEMTKLDFPQ